MALQIATLTRVFEYTKDGKKIPLNDPNPDFSPEEVAKFYAGSFPDLTNAMIEGPKVVGDKATYSLSTKAGKLG